MQKLKQYWKGVTWAEIHIELPYGILCISMHIYTSPISYMHSPSPGVPPLDSNLRQRNSVHTVPPYL
jgi:hypothetical protein